MKQHLFKRAKTGVRQVRNCIDFRGKPWKRGRAQRREKANKYANPKSHQVVFLLIRSVKLYRSVLIMKYLLTVFGEVCTVLYLEYCAITLNKLQTLNKKCGKTLFSTSKYVHVVVKFTANLYLNPFYVGVSVSLTTFLSLTCHSLLF